MQRNAVQDSSYITRVSQFDEISSLLDIEDEGNIVTTSSKLISKKFPKIRHKDKNMSTYEINQKEMMKRIF